ncbi:hypothetical protein ABVK25_005155 [Lepraria finkii]|uniref:Uncharacterized protein n=1 Tax=Lepraria finkii TaxID=1340010 RepID=A0ABR4BAH1_9LECA
MKSQRVVSAILSLLGTRSPHVRSASIITPFQSLIQSSSNSTLIAPDPRFQIIAKFGVTDLPRISSLMNTLEFIAILAAKDYNGKISETNGPLVPGFTDVEIEIKPHSPAATIFTKFAVLGLYYAVTTMARENLWKAAVFGILWEGKHTGWIWFKPPPSSGGNQTEMQDLQNQMQNLTGGALSGALPGALLDLNNTSPAVLFETSSDSKNFNTSFNTSAASATNADFELTMSFFPQVPPLTHTHVFITVISALRDVAMYDIDSVVRPFQIGVEAFHCKIQWEYADGNKLGGPPSFEYKWIIEAARQIPRWMLEHKFAESFFTIGVNGYVIGQGKIFSGQVPGLGMGNVTSS